MNPGLCDPPEVRAAEPHLPRRRRPVWGHADGDAHPDDPNAVPSSPRNQMKAVAPHRWIGFLAAVLLSVCGASAAEEQTLLPDKLNDLPPEVRSFAAAKEKQARALARKLDIQVDPQFWTFFELARKLFDANPDREFYVEESFPLDWMYPHLSPHGLIMKIHRQPLKAIPAEAIDKDRQLWIKQQQQLIGDWLQPGTLVKDVCHFALKIYGRKDLAGFTGDPNFVKDDPAPKAYSKLRSSIGGLYAWRIGNSCNDEDRQRVKTEAELAFKQAYAFCPISPEALFRFVSLLMSDGRIDDARLLALTTLQLNPTNQTVEDLSQQLDRMKRQQKP